MKRRSLATLVVAPLLAACFATENPSSGGEAALAAAREQVTQRNTEYFKIPLTGNADAIAAYWTEDAKIFEPELELNASDLTQYARKFLETTEIKDLQITPIETVAHDEGAAVYVFMNATETMHPKDGKTPDTTSKYSGLARWVKNAEGEWRMHRFIAVMFPDAVTLAVPTPAEVSAPVRALDERLARRQVVDRMNQYLAILRTGDPDALMNFWADDPWYFAGGTHLTSKKDLSRLAYDFLEKNRSSVSLNTNEIFVHDHGAVAYQLGNFEETIEAKDGKTPTAVGRYNFVARWRRGGDDVWRIDRFIATPQPKPTTIAK